LVKRYQQAPHAENLYALAEAQERAGDKEAASESFRKFEQESVTESMLADNSNRELIFYYLDHAHAPAKAMEIAKREMARRHDVFTLDAYAWALAVDGDYAGAQEYIGKALSIGVRDPKILAHARFIAEHAA
jgi:tetratricopeptide (TPR) repeat protein